MSSDLALHFLVSLGLMRDLYTPYYFRLLGEGIDFSMDRIAYRLICEALLVIWRHCTKMVFFDFGILSTR